MPLWVHRTTFQVLGSTAEADLPEAVANYVEEPDLSAVASWDSKYWELAGDVFSLADQATRDAIDAAELTAESDLIADQLDATQTIMRAFSLVVLDELNTLRAQHSLPDRTAEQLKTAVRGKLDG
jgi:hypothetical protein